MFIRKNNRQTSTDSPTVTAELERKVRRSRLVMIFETIWPLFWYPVCVVGVFVLVSLAGLWPHLSTTTHKVVLAGFGVALLLSFIPLIRMRWPSRDDAIRRLEHVSQVPHRPASSYQDKISAVAERGSSAVLWNAHRQRLVQFFRRLRVGVPRPRVDRVDPYGVRAILALALGVLLLANGDGAYDRIASALRLTAPLERAESRLDVWVTPPVYTGKAPILLADGSNPIDADSHEARRVTVPENSLVILRTSGAGAGQYSVQTRLDNEIEAQEIPRHNSNSGDGEADHQLSEYRHKLTGSATVLVLRDGDVLRSWQFDVTDDENPKIWLVDEPKSSARGALRFDYGVEDDYRVIAATAEFTLIDERRPKAAKPTLPDLMANAPVLPLRLPRSKDRKIIAKAYKEMSDHPWAGFKVRLVLKARDQAGQNGESDPVEFTIPERKFTKPLAEALVEQRRKLLIDPGKYRKVALALDALTIAPERFISDLTVYLGIRSAYRRMQLLPFERVRRLWVISSQRDAEKVTFQAAIDDLEAGLNSVTDQLWSLALRIEDGDLSDAERALRAAQENLMKALEEGASAEEIKRLMKDLRQAMSRFLRSLTRQARENQQQNPAGNKNQQSLSQRDLDEMLKNIEDLAKTGSRDEAQQLLSQLRDMMEQLQAGRQQTSPQANQMMQTLEEFGELIRRQQGLLDDTFNAQRRRQSGQDGKGDQAQGRRGPGNGNRQDGGRRMGERGAGSLGDRQGQLRRELQQLLESMKNLGTRTPTPFDGAGQAMDNAQDSIQGGNLDRATEQQSLALERLRRGAQSMTEQMLNQMSGQLGNNSRGRDPLGRPGPARGPDADGRSTRLPGKIDTQRAREILEELRRRMGDTTRPPIEMDYLERLLERF